MAGFVIDIIIGFFVRWIILLSRDGKSRNWPTVAGLVVTSYFEKPGYGGSYVLIHYEYKLDGECFDGEIKKPYFYENYANAFARNHPADSALRVRVNPEHTEQSFPELA